MLRTWRTNRLGRSLPDLISVLQELHGAGADLFLHQQAVAGIARARERGTRSGKPIGRPSISAAQEAAIREHLTSGVGILKTAKLVGVGSGSSSSMSFSSDATVSAEILHVTAWSSHGLLDFCTERQAPPEFDPGAILAQVMKVAECQAIARTALEVTADGYECGVCQAVIRTCRVICPLLSQ
jgi:hypothetical protein